IEDQKEELRQKCIKLKYDEQQGNHGGPNMIMDSKLGVVYFFALFAVIALVYFLYVYGKGTKQAIKGAMRNLSGNAKTEADLAREARLKKFSANDDNKIS